MNQESGIVEKEIVVSEERGIFKESFLFIDKLPKKINWKIRLAGRGSKAELVVVYVGRNKGETEMDIALVHEAEETYGRVIIKAALFDEARLTVKGMLEIGLHAKNSDSYLLARVLLVSPRARAEIDPHLEIHTDAVKASHGASIGRLDEQQLFYMQSRGVRRQDAQYIILSAFFRDVAMGLPVANKQDFFQL
ncbi:MAG: Fe-S cluster assembly protein SufD [Parcubacteria group bacterium Gr01-1014_66]|nr:MAG: Fe-S cluster assembly protein SufD [Parcubacteria group bacterium Gr01-1014_66]